MQVIHFAESDDRRPWLKWPLPGLNSEEADALSDYLGAELKWMTWYTIEEPANGTEA